MVAYPRRRVTVSAETIETIPAASRPIAIWLLICCALVFAMIVIGGITRLTESGLSITEWRPVTGILPPQSAADWQRQFDLYRQTPEFQQLNSAMTLAEFKGIFWWEYIHRLWGRLIGLAFAIPLAWFWLKRRIPPGLGRHLLALLVLGGLQGALGWFMVQSGLSQRTDVSQYRLAAHLIAALVIYSYMFWIALNLLRGSGARWDGALRGPAAGAAVLAALTITFGAFVAGLNGGLVHNTFPLMAGRLIPPDAFFMTPLWRDPFENPVTAQFIHRWLAMATVAAVLWLWARGRRHARGRRLALPLRLLTAVAILQAGLGVATLLTMVPIVLASLHQAGAVLLWTLLLWTMHDLRFARDRGT
jgi:cytochrome c oxidase assembly protein subunit 15